VNSSRRSANNLSIASAIETDPRAVGLLFAGSSTTAIANPIGDVLNAFGVSMVGSGPSASLLRKIFASAKKFLSVAESQAANAQLPPQVNPAAVDAVRRVKERHEGRILSVPGVIGVGVGVAEKAIGQAAVEIYVTQATESLRQALPKSLNSVEVKIVETGEIRAY
jgi:D-alanine-D-alanine ligase-like ATP-grasp enzyme